MSSVTRVALLLMLCLAVPSASVGAHTDQTDRWGYAYGQHWRNTLYAHPTYDYAQTYCFDDWPGGYYSTSANNVRYGLDQWNIEYLKGVNGQDLDFRYTGRLECDGISMYIRLEVLDPVYLGTFKKSAILSPPDHVGVATLTIASRQDIFYGGQPTWEGIYDDRYHVQVIASHESGHGHGYLPPGYHSPMYSSTMYGGLGPGEVKRPGQNLYDREMMDDQYPNK